MPQCTDATPLQGNIIKLTFEPPSDIVIKNLSDEILKDKRQAFQFVKLGETFSVYDSQKTVRIVDMIKLGRKTANTPGKEKFLEKFLKIYLYSKGYNNLLKSAQDIVPDIGMNKPKVKQIQVNTFLMMPGFVKSISNLVIKNGGDPKIIEEPIDWLKRTRKEHVGKLTKSGQHHTQANEIARNIYGKWNNVREFSEKVKRMYVSDVADLAYGKGNWMFQEVYKKKVTPEMFQKVKDMVSRECGVQPSEPITTKEIRTSSGTFFVCGSQRVSNSMYERKTYGFYMTWLLQYKPQAKNTLMVESLNIL
jgi:hypothetical protein